MVLQASLDKRSGQYHNVTLHADIWIKTARQSMFL